jgi:RNA polymerase sigma-70 factor (ECF subfamily)
MSSLPDSQRRALELAYFEGMSHSEIAESMGEALGTVKSWIRGGLMRLRDSLEEASS